MSYPIGSEYLIYWQDFADTTSVKIEISRDNGLTWLFIATGVANDDTFGFVNQYTWIVEPIASSDCKIKVTSEQNASDYVIGESFIIVPSDSTPHFINNITIANGLILISRQVLGSSKDFVAHRLENQVRDVNELIDLRRV